jgi:hypothetical protein
MNGGFSMLREAMEKTIEAIFHIIARNINVKGNS